MCSSDLQGQKSFFCFLFVCVKFCFCLEYNAGIGWRTARYGTNSNVLNALVALEISSSYVLFFSDNHAFSLAGISCPPLSLSLSLSYLAALSFSIEDSIVRHQETNKCHETRDMKTVLHLELGSFICRLLS